MQFNKTSTRSGGRTSAFRLPANRRPAQARGREGESQTGLPIMETGEVDFTAAATAQDTL